MLKPSVGSIMTGPRYDRAVVVAARSEPPERRRSFASSWSLRLQNRRDIFLLRDPPAKFGQGQFQECPHVVAHLAGISAESQLAALFVHLEVLNVLIA